MSLTRLERPLTRAVDDLVVTVDLQGVTLRGLRKRKRRKFVTWQQIASLTDDAGSIIAAAETRGGERELQALGAKEFAAKRPPSPEGCDEGPTT